MRRFKNRGGSKEAGYALVAAMMVMLLLTALGIMAMVTSTSEQRITVNVGEDKMMFQYGEQGVDRILSHLHYLPQGLFGAAEGAALTNTDAVQVLNSNNANEGRALYLYGAVSAPTPNTALNQNSTFRLSAWLDPKDYIRRNPSSSTSAFCDEGYSRELAISVRVVCTATDYQKAFRAYVRPYSIWDLAYFSQNHNPTQRSTSYASCAGASNTWYGCQTVFHNEDTIIGDVYVRTASKTTEDTKPYMRGLPNISHLLLRNLSRYNYGTTSGNNSPFQTKGGSSNPGLIKTIQGLSSYTKEIGMFPYRYLVDTTNLNMFAANADVYLQKNSNKIYKIIFRNDLDTDDNDTYEETRVSSHINFEVNNGSRDTTDYGVFLLYQLPWTTPTRAQWITAMYGDTMAKRHNCLTGGNTNCVTGEIYNPNTASFRSSVTGSGKCYLQRINTSASPTYGPYDVNDIPSSYYFLFTPSVGVARSSWTSAGCSGTSSGIIFVEGDVIVEGILDGKTTVVATGNIYLSHEVQYEEKPKLIQDYCASDSSCNLNEMDMLGLFAVGNIIIPNSFPDYRNNTIIRGNPYLDDWSDAGPDYPGFEGTGTRDAFVMHNDDGNEEIDAVMVSFGKRNCNLSASPPTCSDPQDTDIRDFQVGIYATARTSDGNPWTGTPYPDSSTWSAPGNYSGVLTIVGAMIQDYPGRFSFDHTSSTCTTGSGATCRNIGHRLNLIYDQRLKYTLPAIPKQISANGVIPFGMAAWEITKWDEIDISAVSQTVW